MSFWNPAYADFQGQYAYLGGTSMAAPVVSGAAAIVRQFLREKAGVAKPSGALLKAILVAASERASGLTPAQGANALDGQVGYPDFHQGFGRVNLARVLPHDRAPGRKLLFDEVDNKSAQALRSHDQERDRRAYQVNVSAPPENVEADSLRVVLTWVDPPGQHLQNNLNLYMHGPDNALHLGNAEFAYQRDPLFTNNNLNGVPFDKRNNVLLINLPQAQAGGYTIRVIAQNTLLPIGEPAQGYALCVCGRIAEDALQS